MQLSAKTHAYDKGSQYLSVCCKYIICLGLYCIFELPTTNRTLSDDDATVELQLTAWSSFSHQLNNCYCTPAHILSEMSVWQLYKVPILTPTFSRHNNSFFFLKRWVLADSLYHFVTILDLITFQGRMRAYIRGVKSIVKHSSLRLQANVMEI